MDKGEWIWVVNNSGKMHADRFDSVDYDFPPKEAVEIPVEAANLLFGYGIEDKSDTIRRLGWALTSTDMAAAKERLKEFSFHVERPDAPKIPGTLTLNKENRPAA